MKEEKRWFVQSVIGDLSLKFIIWIVLIAIVMTSIFWIYAFPVIKNELGFGDKIKVDLRIVPEDNDTFWDAQKQIACVQVQRGEDNFNLTKLQVLFSIKGNSHSFYISDIDELPYSKETKIYCFNLIGLDKPDSVKIAPIIIKEEKEKTGEVLSIIDVVAEGKYNASIRVQRRGGGGGGGGGGGSSSASSPAPEPPEEPVNCSNLEHYLNFYQLRYYTGTEKPFPEGLVDFTVDKSYENLENYNYVPLGSIPGHWTASKSNAPDIAVALTQEEIDELFGEETSIGYDKIQRADVEKIHAELIANSSELFLYGFELTYGDADENISNYQQGKTIIQPTTYNEEWTTTFHWNINSPAVREYFVRHALKKMEQSGDNALFFDGVVIASMRRLYEDGDPSKATLHYISEGDVEEQTTILSNYMIDIFREVKERSGGKIILNELRTNSNIQDIFLNILNENLDVIDGIMAENRFWLDKNSVSDIEFYLDWTGKLKDDGDMIVFAASYNGNLQTDSEFVNDIWLWLHLVADTNTYSSIDYEYTTPMINYSVYNLPLGQPLEDSQQQGDVWSRRYDRGNITFDTSSGKLDAIEFVDGCVV